MRRTPAQSTPRVAEGPSLSAQRGNKIAIGGVFLLLVLVLQLKPIDDVDIFWQVKLGQLTIATGELIERDVFSYTHAGKPTPTIGWLAQVIYAGLYEMGGWRAIQLLHVTLFAAAFGIAGLTASHLSSQGRYPVPFILVVGIYLGVMAGLSNADVRPQSFALLGFAAALYIARLGPFSGRGLAGIGVIAILWQNTHPSLSLGVLALGVLALGEWLTRWRQPAHPAPLFLSLATGILALAQLATPMGWHIFDVSTANLHVARDLLKVSEWLPPWDPSVRPAMAGFFLSGGIALVLLIINRPNLCLGDWLLLLSMTGLSLYASRFALFWGIALIPLWTQWLESVRPPHRFAWREAPWSPLAVLAAVYSLPAVLQGKALPHDPLGECLETLGMAVPAGRIYNYREWGGPLIFRGFPQWQVTIDGRLYLYDDQDWQDYADVVQGRVDLDKIMTKYSPDAFVLHPTYHMALIGMLDASQQHRRLFIDPLCAVYTSH